MGGGELKSRLDSLYYRTREHIEYILTIGCVRHFKGALRQGPLQPGHEHRLRRLAPSFSSRGPRRKGKGPAPCAWRPGARGDRGEPLAARGAPHEGRLAGLAEGRRQP